MGCSLPQRKSLPRPGTLLEVKGVEPLADEALRNKAVGSSYLRRVEARLSPDDSLDAIESAGVFLSKRLADFCRGQRGI